MYAFVCSHWNSIEHSTCKYQRFFALCLFPHPHCVLCHHNSLVCATFCIFMCLCSLSDQKEIKTSQWLSHEFFNITAAAGSTLVVEKLIESLQRRHDAHNGVPNQPFLQAHTKEIMNAHALREGNPPVTGGFPSRRASNAKSFFISWRHHDVNNRLHPFEKLYVVRWCN